MFTPGTILAGKYELVEIAGQGGMATVWLARMRDSSGALVPIAVKVMLQRLCNDAHFVSLFVEEARVSAQLSHPNVVHIHDFGEHDGIYYLAMEWVDGLDLLDYTRSFTERGFFVPWAALAAVSFEVLKGLHAAHSHTDEGGAPSPIFHRDVTPHNILLGVSGAVKLTDFGLAKATDRGTMTLPHVLKGKISYTAPEMTRGVRANERTDIFSLGVTFWECLAARKMFDAASPMQIVRQIQAWNVPALDEIRPDLPPDVVSVVNKSIARDPDARFGSAREMALAVSKLLPPRADPAKLGKSIAEAKQRIIEAKQKAAADDFDRVKESLKPDLAAAPAASSFRKASPDGRAARLPPANKPAAPPASIPPSAKIPRAPVADVKISVRGVAPLSVVEELSGLIEEVSDSSLLPPSSAAPAAPVAPAPAAPAAPRAPPPPPRAARPPPAPPHAAPPHAAPPHAAPPHAAPAHAAPPAPPAAPPPAPPAATPAPPAVAPAAATPAPAAAAPVQRPSPPARPPAPAPARPAAPRPSAAPAPVAPTPAPAPAVVSPAATSVAPAAAARPPTAPPPTGAARPPAAAVVEGQPSTKPSAVLPAARPGPASPAVSPAPPATPAARPAATPAAPAVAPAAAKPAAPAAPAAGPAAAPAAARPAAPAAAPAVAPAAPAAPAAASAVPAVTPAAPAVAPAVAPAAPAAKPRVARPAEPSLLDISIEFDLMGGQGPRATLPTLPSNPGGAARKPGDAAPVDDKKKEP